MLRVASQAAASLSILSILAVPAHAAVFDHLHCYKIKDQATKTTYTADLAHSDLTFPNAVGCEIKVPAKLLCVDTDKSNVAPTPPGAAAGAATQKYLCYKAKCPKEQPTATLSDQFGSHALEVKSTSLLCAPIPNPATCSDSIQNGAETDVDCGGGTCPTCDDGDSCLLASDCTSANCASGTCTPAAPTCSDLTQNGLETDVDCGGGTCPDCADGDGCASDSDCVSNSCFGGVCVTLLGNGSACSSSGQCSSNSCVDGFCCNSACGGVCEACSAVKKGSGMNGACGPIVVATDPDNECATQPAATCSTNGTCSGSGSCSLYAAGTACVAGSCTSGVQQNTDTCNGMGFCTDNGSTPCAPYACGATTCRTFCSSDVDCASSAYCSGGACVNKLIDGAACMANGHCINGNCVDGVCCDTACASLCQACSAAKKSSGTDGSCGNIAVGTDPDSECAGTCDGAGACQP
jgi:hypothetical protein